MSLKLTSSISVTHPTSEWKTYGRAWLNGLPLAVSVFAYGIAYGALAHSTNHLTLYQTLTMSIVVFAGASQFTILALLHQNALLWTIVCSTFLLNARQILYAFTLGPPLAKIPRKTLALLAHGLTDESFSVTSIATQNGPVSAAYFAGAGSAVFLPWLFASALGFAVGGIIGDPARFGLDFAFIGAFLGLLIAQLKTPRHVVAAGLAAIGATLASKFFGTSGAVFVGAVIAFVIGVTSHE